MQNKFIIILLLAIFSSCGGTKHEPTPIINKPIAAPVEVPIEFNKDVYVTDNINDENSANVTESSSTVSFWYVYYNVHVKASDDAFTGYKVIQLSTPYFTINEALKKIYPSVKDEDFVGVEFFKRVPIETYNATKSSDK